MGRSHTEFTLSANQRRRLERDGFLSIADPVAADQEVAFVRDTLRRLFADRVGWREGALFDMVTGSDGPDTQHRLPELYEPVNYEPRLRRLAYRRTALDIARQILGPAAVPSFEHAVFKPAHIGAETPWHQDEAYRMDPGLRYDMLTLWLPLQDVDAASGCMRYIPGSHHGPVLEHGSVNGDPAVHAIECTAGFDPATAVDCPLPPGGVVIHRGRTLHGAGANGSPVPRYAYILVFEIPPVPGGEPPGRASWSSGRRSAMWRRRRAWLRRGGLAVLIARKLRYGLQGSLLDARNVVAQLRRTVRYVRLVRRS